MLHGLRSIVVLGALHALGFVAGCGKGQATPGGDGGGSDAARDATMESAACLGCDAQATQLTILPSTPTIDVTWTPNPTPNPSPLQLYAALAGTDAALTGVTWVSDDPLMAIFDPTMSGVLTATGNYGGTVAVHANAQSLTATANVTVTMSLVDNPATATTAQQASLRAGGPLDAGFAWLYPYDKTVFPNGLTPPTLQWAGAKSDMVYIHVSFPGFDYEGFFPDAAPGQLALPPTRWTQMTRSAPPGVPVKVDVSRIVAGAVHGPIEESWLIAPGSLKGSVYYNTYTSPSVAGGAAIMRVRPGTPGGGATPITTGCVVCHSVSADGSTLVAAAAPLDTSPYDSYTYDLGTLSVVYHEPPNVDSFGFGGLYPDGSLLMLDEAAAVDPKTGSSVPTTGLTIPGSSAPHLPSFSPDGKQLGFAYLDLSKIAVFAFDKPSGVFSGLATAASATDPGLALPGGLPTGTQPLYLAWPTFTPDGKWVLFHAGNRDDGYTYNWPDFGMPTFDGKGDLGIAHLASGTATKLDQLNGSSGGTLYLPYGEEEAHMNFEPTVLPVAVGGYYWVVFSSRRQYGNTLNDPSPYAAPVGSLTEPAARRHKLWVAALDIDSPESPSTRAHDISHPAFYLDEQELAAGNMHGFWALDPCEQQGVACASGDECCTGFCRASGSTDGGPALVCVPKPAGCAQEYESCTTTADCCKSGSQVLACINGKCAVLAQ